MRNEKKGTEPNASGGNVDGKAKLDGAIEGNSAQYLKRQCGEWATRFTLRLV
ncbi:hypothetical protein FHS16_004177 [Paenibacillus endophyticus]|uniref:Uncharacterized protein n=1 Tax=Paenibacillus endophyticus TaxID=1294268 RepID=A0A7W5CAE8_9BACL|nr:hypothetical protein [Paenibacillus endophyticus]MBB3154101.1 hypothetical protein [Paenibacillus endophyticus]